MYEDKTLICKDCGKEFVFTAGEQEFYAEKGFQNQPQRCRPCRQARKGNAAPQREMYTGVCAACGKEARVPFQPRASLPQAAHTPVYISRWGAALPLRAWRHGRQRWGWF